MDILRIVQFVEELERLKDVNRCSWTGSGRHESTAEHSWRLAVMAAVWARHDTEVCFERVLVMSLIHDVGEIYIGDISAYLGSEIENKYEAESEAVEKVFGILDEAEKQWLLDIWQEYNDGMTKEARLVKALDKAETIIQHNQGANPEGLINYNFNLGYGKSYFEREPKLEVLREILDQGTMKRYRDEQEEKT